MRFLLGGGVVLFTLAAACGGSTDTTTDPAPSASTSSSGNTGSSSGTGTTHPPAQGMSPPRKQETPEAHDNYRAWSQPGGLDHLFVARSDAKSDTCIRIHLVTPSSAPPPLYAKVTPPRDWSIQNVTMEPGAATCLSPDTQPGAGEETGYAAGTIGATWRVAGGIVPCTLDVHAAFGFSKVGNVNMYVLGLKVDDCTM